MNNNERIRKGFDFKAELRENRGRGAASVMGNIDRGGDVIFPGAFKSAIPGFLKSGFVSLGHDWGGEPIGMPVSCKEVGGQLDVEWEYHNTERAQSARQVAMERSEKGLTVGLSVGFMPDYEAGAKFFANGAELLKFAEEEGYDLSQFDTKAIKKYKYFCRALTKISELYEFGQVNVPMNPDAVASAVKQHDLGEGDPLAGMPFAEHLDSVLAAVEGAADRFKGYAQMREAEDRPVSQDRLAQLRSVHEQLGGLIKSCEVDHSPTMPDELLALQVRDLELRHAGLV